MADCSLIIIGAGVVGLSCAQICAANGINVLVIEKHHTFGQETSSRNSEVIHAGLYYPKHLLKSRLCIEGNPLLYQWCSKHNVNFRKTGKYVTASSNEQKERLHEIFQNATDCGLTSLSMLSRSEIENKLPQIIAEEVFFSPETGIIDSHEFMASLEADSINNGALFAYNHKIISIQKVSYGYVIEAKTLSGDIVNISCEKIINCSGLAADLTAQSAGIDIDKAGYRQQFCKGHYFRLASKYKFDNLIYPAVPRNSLGLGIHLTIDLNGNAKLGPDSHLLDNNLHDYNVPESLKSFFFNTASLYIKGINPEDIWADYSGIRPKLKIQGFADFIINEESDIFLPGLINCIGIESPGLTSSLATAKYIYNKFIV